MSGCLGQSVSTRILQGMIRHEMWFCGTACPRLRFPKRTYGSVVYSDYEPLQYLMLMHKSAAEPIHRSYASGRFG